MKKAALLIPAFILVFLLFSAFKYDPVFERQYLNEADRIFSMGKYRMALNLYKTAYKMNPANIDTVTGMGNCCTMLGDEKAAAVNYGLARDLDPKFTAPDLSRYIAMDRERLKGKPVAELQRRYYDMFPGMKKTEIKPQPAYGTTYRQEQAPGQPQQQAQGAQPGQQAQRSGARASVEAQGPANVLTEAEVKSMTVTEKNKPDMEHLTDEQALTIINDRLYDYRGGHAKMESLGGMRFIIPDMTTSMDGGYLGLDTALLFRKTTHVFNLEPFYGVYDRKTKSAVPGVDTSFKTQLVSLDDSMGELNSPNEYFFNRAVPLLANSFSTGGMTTGVPDLDRAVSNTGSKFGGMYTLGFKPIPAFAMSFTAGYEYEPYLTASSTGETATAETIGSTRFSWNAGAGFSIPLLLLRNDQLEADISYGSYRPAMQLSDITNNEWLDLPYSLLYDYSKKMTQGGELEADVMRYEDSRNLDVTGNDLKAGLHYMIGNNDQEFFLYADIPHNIKLKVSRTLDLIEEGTGLTVSSTVIAQEDAGTEKRWNGKAGFRNNFRYVTVGARYELDTRETYYSTTYTADFTRPLLTDSLTYQGTKMLPGREYERNGRLILGVNVTPTGMINIPFEYEMGNYYLSMGGSELLSDSSTIRAGLQVKPMPFAAIRGGISYQVIRNNILSGGKTVSGNPGTDANPTVNLWGYHFGAGFELPIFEVNFGGAIKRIYKDPLPLSISTESTQYMYGYVDFNIYI